MSILSTYRDSSFRRNPPPPPGLKEDPQTPILHPILNLKTETKFSSFEPEDSKVYFSDSEEEEEGSSETPFYQKNFKSWSVVKYEVLRYGKYKGQTYEQMVQKKKTRSYLRHLLNVWRDMDSYTREMIKTTLSYYDARKIANTSINTKREDRVRRNVMKRRSHYC